MSPFGYLGLILVVISPVLGRVDVWVIIVGRRVCSPRVSAFLFMVTTPPLGHGWLIQAGGELFWRVKVWTSYCLAKVVVGWCVCFFA